MAKKKRTPVTRLMETGYVIKGNIFHGDSVICKGVMHSEPNGGYEYCGNGFKGKVIEIKYSDLYPYGIALNGSNEVTWWGRESDLEKY